MKPTEYKDINHLLEELTNNLRTILEEKLVGLYLYGSLVWGDFDIEISDIDLLAVTKNDIDAKDFAQLNTMQNLFVQKHKKWDDRIEIAYLSLNALATFKTQSSQIAIISPGESFTIKEAGNDWLINWYTVREQSKTLFGADPKTIIEPISKKEFIDAVKKQAMDWRDWIIQTKDSRPYQAYAILTLCRALYACKKGQQASKKKAAEWATKEIPESSEQIKKALQWRKEYKNKDIDHEATYPETVKFVNHIIDLIANQSSS